ncbi:hypothetical protein OPV22_024182 [Ensete ventricosum]|uniref:Uncharacterized protein n=1 Tax=Ensete ventricosum TaxID=4639 RepID=A0AAV8PDP5_ENSVE|nr:hypothetical protein OPV22_024182 [Ensete ventricosum]
MARQRSFKKGREGSSLLASEEEEEEKEEERAAGEVEKKGGKKWPLCGLWRDRATNPVFGTSFLSASCHRFGKKEWTFGVSAISQPVKGSRTGVI